MRSALISGFIFFYVALTAQQKVSEWCQPQKILLDSVMRWEYGNYLFDNFFVFDTNSYVITNRDFCRWNDTLKGDSIMGYMLNYAFQFPGAQSSYPWLYGWPFDRNGKLHNYAPPVPPYGRSCNAIAVDSITRTTERELHVPMDSCSVMLYWVYVFPHRSQLSADTMALTSMHPGDLYLRVTYAHDRELPAETRKDRKNPKIECTDYILVFDACTGELAGSYVSHKMIRKKDYYGVW